MFNIKEAQALKIDAVKEISYLFCISRSNVETLLSYGFVYEYSERKFKTQIIINSITYNIFIHREVDNTIKKFRICIRTNSLHPTILKGANEIFLYSDVKNHFADVEINTFIIWIRNVYNLNNNEKDTFKQFVESEK